RTQATIEILGLPTGVAEVSKTVEENWNHFWIINEADHSNEERKRRPFMLILDQI
ncbi:uncharacterized protein BDR25DRAFT_168277, partial [Lindgomyces ingoldianus]